MTFFDKTIAKAPQQPDKFSRWEAFLNSAKCAASSGLRCHLCTQNSHSNAALCNQCLEELPIINKCCPVCALPLSQNTTCGDCLKQNKPYQSTSCALLYQNPVSHLMQSFKEQSQWQIGKLFCELWLQNNQATIASALKQESVALVPIPGDKLHSAKRGFIPTLFIAQYLSRATTIPLELTLKSTGQIRSQKTLKRKQRLSNLQGVFTASKPLSKHLIIIDDVVTSCATAIAASRTLLLEGANSTEIWAIARTPIE